MCHDSSCASHSARMQSSLSIIIVFVTCLLLAPGLRLEASEVLSADRGAVYAGEAFGPVNGVDTVFVQLAPRGSRADSATYAPPRRRQYGPDPPIRLPEGVPYDDRWWGGFSRPGVSGVVKAGCGYEGRVLLGGEFLEAGDSLALGFATWDGTALRGFKSVTPHRSWDVNVLALHTFNGSPMAGMECSCCNWPQCVHRWDGASWSVPGGGFSADDFPGCCDFPENVRAWAEFDGYLVAGGLFYGEPFDFIAKWDGESWSSLGEPFDLWVYALTVYDGRLIAGGAFREAAGIPANRVAAWDGVEWAALGSGINDDIRGGRYVNALEVYDGKLVAGGVFSKAGSLQVDRLASWDGTDWSSLGFEAGGYVDGVVPSIDAMVVYDGNLIVGGLFREAEGAVANHVASWDGETWSDLGAGVDGKVMMLHVYDDVLLVGGSFTFAGGVSAYGAAVWDGISWHAMGGGQGLEQKARTMIVHDDRLIVGGNFTVAGDTPVGRAAAWDGVSWSAVGEAWPVGGSVADLNSVNGTLFGAASTLVKRWNGTSWDVYPPAGETVRVIGAYQGQLVAGEDNVLIWDGAEWQTLGFTGGGEVYALIEHDGKLIAGGDFGTMDGQVVNNIAAWDGETWQPVGGGFLVSGHANLAAIYDLEVAGGDLLAGGHFYSSGEEQIFGVARWDGEEWTGFGTGITRDVYALEMFNETLVAAGDFDLAGGRPAINVARWNGSGWAPFGSGTNDYVEDLLVFGGDLYLSGSFTQAGGKNSFYVARWHDEFPGMVMDFTAEPSDSAVCLSWRNPATALLEGVYICYSTAGYPGDPTEGQSLPTATGGFFTGPPGYAGSFVHRGLTTGVTCYYAAFAYDNSLHFSTPAWISATPADSLQPSSVETVGIQLMDGGSVGPNPFERSTKIRLTIEERQALRIAVYDVTGRIVAVLADGLVDPGDLEVVWDGTNAGADLPGGVYFLRIEGARSSATKKLVLIH